ncbi:MAG: DUF479 domain-containing protein [Flammeovirgaceae bacterium]|nr:DUF479 domain-containing protein [Flammeovirgaceae bacterium]
MNFLAHLYLSEDHPKVMVGNFIGDFVRGRNLTEQFEADVARGIELHRAIDEFTDTHPIVKKSKDRLRPEYRHYSPVIVDIFYDHFLAADWKNYHPVKLEDYTQFAYQTIMQFDDILPERVKYLLPFMTKGNWLLQYATIEGIHRALSGMANRTPYESKMEMASEDLRKDYSLYKKEFTEFFGELQTHSHEWLQNN